MVFFLAFVTPASSLGIEAYTQGFVKLLWDIDRYKKSVLLYLYFCVCPLPHLSLSCSLLQDAFFYSLVYDPTQKTLLADKGEIRVGPRFQADVPDMLQEGDQKHTGTSFVIFIV